MARTAAASRWNRFALPSVTIDAPDDERGRRDGLVDGLMYLVAFALGCASLAASWELHPDWLRPVAIAIGIAAIVALRWRRSHPVVVGIVVCAVSTVVITAAGASFVALFNGAIRTRGRDLAVIAALAITACFTRPMLWPDESYVADVAAGLLVTAIAVGWGLFVRARRDLLRTLRDQAARAGEEAREAERRRIAREMHDVLAHRLSLLSVHAGALEFNADCSAEEVAEAAGVIRESARAALEELRGVIGVLREDTGESLTGPPQPTLADLPTLVGESRAAGMRIDVRVELGDVAPPEAAGRTAYRIVQEGLTNARKHAPGAAVTLSVDVDGRDLRIVVRSLAPVGVAAAPLPGAGTGLIGLAERVSLAGGELGHGVDPDGAFVLRARLPR